MKAVSRVGKLLFAAAVALAPAVAGAQQTPPTGNTTAPETVGPRELQNFKLPGTVTRPADQPAPITAPPADRPRTEIQTPTETRTQQRQVRAAPSAARPPSAEAPGPSLPRQESAPAPSPGLVAPVASDNSPPPPMTSLPGPRDAQPSSDRRSVPLFVWLLAATVLGAGGALLFRRHRLRQEFAGVPEVDAFEEASAEPPLARASAPEPVRPAAPPAPRVESAPVGLVSTRLRPWIEIGFNPLRCVLDNERVTIDFELELVNSGNAPARDLLVDATAFNAGPGQDAMINGFFAAPREGGQRIEALPPLQRIVVPLQLMIPRDQLQPYELGGKQVFVPVVALNAIYRWTINDGQTSASYLLGRGTEGEKLAPFRLDAGPRIFRGTAARVLAPSVRR